MFKNSLQKTLSIIKKNKPKIFLIFFLQIIFFITLSLIFYHTIIPAMHHAKSAVDYYDEINVTEDSGTFGYLGKEPSTIYKNYDKMMFYLKFMALFLVLDIIIISGLLWTLTDSLINKKNLKQSFNYFNNFGILTLTFILLFYILIFNTLKTSLATLEYSLLPLTGILVLFAVLIYFLFISFTLINKRKLKDILKLTFKNGILKFPKSILIYLINLVIIFLFSYLLYLVIEANIILLSIVLILFILSFVFARLFLIIAIKDLP
jgi:hypothetical protein